MRARSLSCHSRQHLLPQALCRLEVFLGGRRETLVSLAFCRGPSGTSLGASERRGILWRWRGPSGLRWVWRNGPVRLG